MTAAQTMLRNMLVDLARAEKRQRRGHRGYYAGGADFVLREGVDYPVRSPASHAIMGPPSKCYGNAIYLAAVIGLPYVEGFALPSEAGLPTPHAWNLDPAGRVIDSTWISTPIGHGAAYRGVVFDVTRADIASWDDDSHVLRWETNPLYDEPWTGEHEWPENERVATYRRGSWDECADMLERMHEEAELQADVST